MAVGLAVMARQSTTATGNHEFCIRVVVFVGECYHRLMFFSYPSDKTGNAECVCGGVVVERRGNKLLLYALNFNVRLPFLYLIFLLQT